MSCNEWKEYALKDIIEFNPRETIKKGQLSKKVPMDKLEPFTRKISGYEETSFTSGTKFRNGDTLLARITPCLENGKTARVDILEDNEIGFGSTEFIVMREKEGKTINDFIYYLSISPEFRNIAIKSMTGSSGRQRVQKDVLENVEIKLPPLEEQEKIANILSSLDDKIELNNEMNKTLEEMAQSIFKRWFVDFEFPNEDGEPYKSSGGEMVDSELGIIPKGWDVGTLDNLGVFKNGKGIKQDLRNDNGKNLIYGSNGIIGKTDDVLQKDNCIIIGRVGAYCGSIQLSLEPCWVTDNAIMGTAKQKEYLPYLHRFLLNYPLRESAGGSAQPLINQSILKSILTVIPPNELFDKYYNISKEIISKIDDNNKENIMLCEIRDSLLPKLMSGEIKV